MVLETEDDPFLGTAEVLDGCLVIRSGDVGRPTLVALEEGEAITPLTEEDYNEAMRAHAVGLQVTATGNMEVRGTRTYLQRVTHFGVVPGLL